MILVDTSVWIDHLRRGDEHLSQLLDTGNVLVHAHVIGELALGNLKDRGMILSMLQDMPQAPLATHEEVLHLIDLHALSGTGIGYTDVHLIAAVRLVPGSRLWSRDRRLLAASIRLDVAYRAIH